MTATDPPSTPSSAPGRDHDADSVLAEIDRLNQAYAARPVPSAHSDLAAWWARGAELYSEMETWWIRALDITPCLEEDRLLRRALLAAAHGAAAQASACRREARDEALSAGWQ